MYYKTAGHLREGGAHPLHPPPRSAPEIGVHTIPDRFCTGAKTIPDRTFIHESRFLQRSDAAPRRSVKLKVTYRIGVYTLPPKSRFLICVNRSPSILVPRARRFLVGYKLSRVALGTRMKPIRSDFCGGAKAVRYSVKIT